MREIKFRVWHKLNQQMIYEGWNGDVFVDKAGIFAYGEDGEVTDYTSLKDENGKEIYEGDFLMYLPKGDWDEKNYTAFEVFFHDGDANSDYNIGYSINRTHYQGSICGTTIPRFIPKTTSQMIVIGNIYENPELLKL